MILGLPVSAARGFRPTSDFPDFFAGDAIGGAALDYDVSTNDVGNINAVASVSEGNQTLGYDRLDRLNEVRDANAALIEAFAYDATGNRLSQQIGSGPVVNYSYPDTSHRLTQVGSTSRTYDAVGNTLTGVPGFESDSASFDVRNRLSQIAAQQRNEYNGRGERVLSSQGSPAPALPTASGDWTQAGLRGQLYDERGQVISTLQAGSSQRYEDIVWLDHTPVARVLSDANAVTTVHVIHSDHLNTPRALANAQSQGGQPTGTIVWRWTLNQQSATGSNAFGSQPANEDPDGNSSLIQFDLRFPGQQYDSATGLHYNYFRDYEAGTGRYMESDPIGLRGGGPQTYAYVYSHPLRYHDTDGLKPMTPGCCRKLEKLVEHDDAQASANGTLFSGNYNSASFTDEMLGLNCCFESKGGPVDIDWMLRSSLFGLEECTEYRVHFLDCQAALELGEWGWP